MIALGLVCLLLAAALIIGMLVSGTSQDVLFQNRIGELTTSPLWIFVAGVIVTLLTLAGLSFFSKGTKHRVARRKEMNRLRKVEQEYVHPTEPTTTAEGTAAATVSESGGHTGYRQQPDERPVVEMAPHEQGRPDQDQTEHDQTEHDQTEHDQSAPKNGTSVTLGEQHQQDTTGDPGPHGATLDQPSHQHDR